MSQQRYELRDILGRGGMGAVYRAYDRETRREVTVKTLLDVGDRNMLDLFYKECHVLASLNHPNIVDIYDVGEMEFEGDKRPYFVMPLLSGVTLDKLIAGASPRLTVDRIVEILTQSCRGLHAAHERGLVHRDIKPSNIFVMDDDSVKIIDFGVAHLTDSRTLTTVKGTLHYMAPEQIQMQKPTALSDLFSLSVVAYQTFTRKKPFEAGTMDETIQSILHLNPPPVSEMNPGVNRGISQVIHKGMAKQPWHRFTTAREFGEHLQKALRGEAIEAFDDSKILPRVQKARRALEAAEFEFANEVLSGLESEGFLHTEIGALRRDLNQATRTKKINQLLSSARRFLEEDEFQLALQKLQELKQTDPSNLEADDLRAEIESRKSDEQVERWVRIAQEHLGNHAYSHARQAVENALQAQPDDTKARKLLAEIQLDEQQYNRLRAEKESLYHAAVDSWQRGDLTTALSGMERVMDIDRQAPGSSGAGNSAVYQNFYNLVRTDHDSVAQAYEQAKAMVAAGSHQAALSLCEASLARYPNHAMFQALKMDAEEGLRQDVSAFIARVDKEAEAEPDLDRRVAILERALGQRPGESHFEAALALARSKRDLVHSIVTKARGYENRNQFSEAISQWEMLKSIYPSYPGLEFEIERTHQRRELHAKDEAKARWAEQIDRAAHAGDFVRALDLSAQAMAEFPGDPELAALEDLARQGGERAEQAAQKLEKGRQFLEIGELDQGLELIHSAFEMNPGDSRLRSGVLDALLHGARSLFDTDWKRAEKLIEQALSIDPDSSPARSLRSLVQDRKRAEFIDQCVARARQCQASGDLDQALAAVHQGLAAYPSESRLQQLKGSLERSQTDSEKSQKRLHDLELMRGIERRSRGLSHRKELERLFEETIEIARAHIGDNDFDAIVKFLREQVDRAPAREPETAPPPAPQSTTPPPSATPLAAPTSARAPVQPVSAPSPPPPVPAPTVVVKEPEKKVEPPAVTAPPPKPAHQEKPKAKEKPKAAPPPAPTMPKPAAGSKTGPLVAVGVFVVVVGSFFAYQFLIARQAAAPPVQQVPVEPPPVPVPASPPVEPPPEAPPVQTEQPPGPAAAPKGSILIAANEAGFEAFLDGQKVRVTSRRPGQFYVYNLTPGKRELRLEKQGSRVEPATLQIEVRENQVTQASFRLSAAQQPLRVVLRGAVAGTQVSAGGRNLGAVDPTGSLAITDLAAGDHTLQLRLRNYRPKQVQVSLRSGEVVVGPPDSVVERMEGMITFNGAEPRSGMSLRIDQTDGEIRYSGPNPIPELPREVRLPPGSYNLTFAAPGYGPETVHVVLVDQRTLNMPVKLTRR